MSTKSIIWNKLKTLGFDSKQLKSVYDVSYQSASKELLESILASLENEVGEGVKEDLGMVSGGVTGNDINSSEIVVNYKGFNYNPKNQYVTMDNTLIGMCLPENFITAINNGWFNSLSCCISENDLICQLPNQKVKETPSTIVATETSDNKFKGIPVEQLTKTEYQNFKYQFRYSQANPDELRITTNSRGLHSLRIKNQVKVTRNLEDLVVTAKEWLATESEKINLAIASNQVHQYAAVLGGQQQKQVPISEPLPGSVVLSKTFNYDAELLKLKSLSRQEFMALIQEVQHAKHFSSYYIPKWETLESYLTISESKILDGEIVKGYVYDKVVNIQDCFSEAGNYHYSQMQLTPKLELFAKCTEFTYLANCFSYLLSELTRYNQQWNKLINDFSSSVFEFWYSINDLVHQSYIPQPLPTHNDYVTMLQLL